MDKFVKHDAEKPRPELIPAEFLDLLGQVFAYGAKKYSDDNWRKCEEPRRYLGAALRHLIAYQGGEELDPESGLPHLGHAGASLAMLVGLGSTQRDQDTPTYPTIGDALAAQCETDAVDLDALADKLLQYDPLIGK